MILDTVSSHSGDVVNSESFSDEGSESDSATISDRAEEQGNGMIDFFQGSGLKTGRNKRNCWIFNQDI